MKSKDTMKTYKSFEEEKEEKEKEILKLLGKEIARKRNTEKLSQAQLGELCDLDTTTIWRIENGHINSKFLNVIKIILELDIDMLDLKDEIKKILKLEGDGENNDD